MVSTLFTIGFTQISAEEFFGLLQQAGVAKLMDIRENRIGQLSGFAKFPDLAFFLERMGGITYEYHPCFAPTPEIRSALITTGDWEQYESAFRKLMAERHAIEQADAASFEGKVALLCSEPRPEKCHRRLVAEMLAERFVAEGHQVEVRHLVSPRCATGKKPRKGRNERTDSF